MYSSFHSVCQPSSARISLGRGLYSPQTFYTWIGKREEIEKGREGKGQRKWDGCTLTFLPKSRQVKYSIKA